MAFEWMLLAVVAATDITVLLVLAGFWAGVVRPYLDRKVSEVVEAAENIEPGVKRGVREGVEETLRELPEATLKESTNQFRRFGSDLFENGLSSFLGATPGSSRNKKED
jgi:uncharacterized protein YbjT (DUF2867 family)